MAIGRVPEFPHFQSGDQTSGYADTVHNYIRHVKHQQCRRILMIFYFDEKRDQRNN